MASSSGNDDFGDEELDTYSAIYERDVDIMMVMALRSSSPVRELICGSVEVPANPLVSVRHSLTTSDGREADIELRTGEAQQPHVVEIENKIDAEFQLGQIESYRVRARASEASGDVASARTLLLAPHAYLSAAGASADLFHSAVSYEDVRDCLRDESPWGREAALLVEHGIQQHRRGGRQAVTDDARTSFFAEFAKRAEARGLPHFPPIPRSAGAGFFSYPREATLIQPKGWGPSGSRRGAWLVAKFELGRADIDLIGILDLVADHDSLIAALEQEPFAVAVRPAGVGLQIQATQLDPDVPIEDQLSAVDHLIECLVDAKTWWESRGRALIEEHL